MSHKMKKKSKLVFWRQFGWFSRVGSHIVTGCILLFDFKSNIIWFIVLNINGTRSTGSILRFINAVISQTVPSTAIIKFPRKKRKLSFCIPSKLQTRNKLRTKLSYEVTNSAQYVTHEWLLFLRQNPRQNAYRRQISPAISIHGCRKNFGVVNFRKLLRTPRRDPIFSHVKYGIFEIFPFRRRGRTLLLSSEFPILFRGNDKRRPSARAFHKFTLEAALGIRINGRILHSLIDIYKLGWESSEEETGNAKKSATLPILRTEFVKKKKKRMGM